MNKREKLLAAAVGLLVLLFLGKVATDRVRGAFTRRDNDIRKHLRAISEKKRVVAAGQEAAAEIAAREKLSLPSAPETASTFYREWLHSLVDKAKLADANVTALPYRPHGDVYKRFTFVVQARGNLEQLTHFLFDFYSVAHLHRINMLVAKPILDSDQKGRVKDLDLTISIEAISLPNSSNNEQLTDQKSNRLALDSVEDYLKKIVGRNYYAPPNQPPTLRVDFRPTYYEGDTIAFNAAGQDPDQDGVSYALGENAPEGAQIDPRSGKFTFRPNNQGQYQFEVLVTDDGLPRKTATQQVSFTVTERPPAPVAEYRPPAPAFDPAKFAYVTGITDTGGLPEVWIFVRTEGRMLKLREGDRLDVGGVQGVVTQIRQREADFDSDGGKMTVALGQNLAEARQAPSGE